MTQANKFKLDADEAFVKTEIANEEKSSTVDKFLDSTIATRMLVNFINARMEKAIKMAHFQMELCEEAFSDFSSPYDILCQATIILCARQNYRARVKVDGCLLISWKSPAEMTPVIGVSEKPFVFRKPDEIKVK